MKLLADLANQDRRGELPPASTPPRLGHYNLDWTVDFAYRTSWAHTVYGKGLAFSRSLAYNCRSRSDLADVSQVHRADLCVDLTWHVCVWWVRLPR